MSITLKNKHTFEIRNAESFNHAIRISKPFGSIDRIVEWAKSELKDEWRWQVVQTSTDLTPGQYIFYFDSESDYLAFVMKHS
jgi:lantibiotic modifying enzyme